MDYYIKVLALYFPPVKFLSKQKRAMRHGIKKMCSLKLRHYVARLIGMNEYLASFLEMTLADKMDVTELDDIILNIIRTSWYKQAYVQGFDFKFILFKKAVNMFEHMEIAEYICVVVV